MTTVFAAPVGQRADYELEVGGGHDLVVSEFGHGFEVGLDARRALTDFAEALRVAPAISVVGMIVSGSLITYHSRGWSDANDRRRSGLQSTHQLPYCRNGWKPIPSAARSLNG